MSPRGILLDIEGTTSSISFVYDVMFPFIRRELAGFLKRRWNEESLAACLELLAVDAGFPSFADWQRGKHAVTVPEQQTMIRDEVTRLMDADVKATGLKQLQGMIWEEGFQSGELKAHVFDDVPPALQSWANQGIELRIYSSGSVQAQKLFFAHTDCGNLLPLFGGHYDTTVGPKKLATSYRTIVDDFDRQPTEILFLSDVVAELDAAREAGLQTTLVKRPGNAAIDREHGHAEITSFNELHPKA